jgi:hypothetical protein
METERTPTHLHLVERQPVDLNDNFAEQHQVDPDEAAREALYAEISDALIWLGLGALAGSFAVVVAAYIIGQFVL